MSPAGKAGRRSLRAAARGTALVTVIAASGIAVSAASAAGPRRVALQIGYTCRFPGGSGPARALIAATVPAAVTAGRPVRPRQVSVTMTMPRAVAAYLAGHGFTSVTGTGRLAMTVAGNGGPTSTMTWPGRIAPTPVPRAGGLTITASGAVPAITAPHAGSLTLTAGRAAVVIGHQSVTPGTGPVAAATTAPSPGTTPPATTTLSLTCAPAPGQPATLVTLPVSDGKPVTGRKRRTHPHHHYCPQQPPGGLKLNPRFPPPKPPPGSTRIKTPPQPGCAYAVGYADVRKQKEAALLGPALSDVEQYVKLIANPAHNYLLAESALQLEYHGLAEFPPAKATFLTFHAIPTTATMHLIEIGSMDGYSVGTYQSCPTCLQRMDIYGVVEIRISNVMVNGTPLNVGKDCGTPAFEIHLAGTNLTKPPYSLNLGGPLFGMIDIPKFTRCGVGENIDPVFNAAISGKNNFNLLSQGGLCTTLNGYGCPAKIPKPLRSVQY